MSDSIRNMSHRLDYIMKDDVILKKEEEDRSHSSSCILTLNYYCQGYLLFLSLHISEFKVHTHLAISSLSLSLFLRVEQIFFSLLLFYSPHLLALPLCPFIVTFLITPNVVGEQRERAVSNSDERLNTYAHTYIHTYKEKQEQDATTSASLYR